MLLLLRRGVPVTQQTTKSASQMHKPEWADQADHMHWATKCIYQSKRRAKTIILVNGFSNTFKTE
jgi:hypothetical protein